MINAMFIQVESPFNLWVEALLAAYHILNRTPSKKNKTSPDELYMER